MLTKNGAGDHVRTDHAQTYRLSIHSTRLYVVLRSVISVRKLHVTFFFVKSSGMRELCVLELFINKLTLFVMT
jgi:hypothetical protein